MDANLGLSAISRALSLNASYLSDAFRRFHGQTLSQYITQVRMAKARDLLLSGELSLVGGYGAGRVFGSLLFFQTV